MEMINTGTLKEIEVVFCTTKYILQCNKRIVYCKHRPDFDIGDFREFDQEVILYK